MKNLVKTFTVVCALLMCFASVNIQAQPGGDRGGDRGERGGRGGDRGGRGNWNSEEMKKRMAEWQQRSVDRQKEELGASDDEWSVIEPLLKAVQEKQWAQRMSGGGRGGRGGGVSENTPTEVKELSEVLKDDNASADDIKAKLKAFRAYKKKQKDELVAAQKELQKVLTVKQEAYFVARGTLE